MWVVTRSTLHAFGCGAGLSLLLGMASLGAEETSPATAPEAPAATGPRAMALVTLDPPGPVELGTVYAEETREIRLQITNRSDAPVRLNRVRSTCPCTVPNPPSTEPVPPGGSTEVSAQLIGAKLRDGPFRRHLIIDFAEAAQPAIDVELQGTRMQALAITPSRDVTLPPGVEPGTAWQETFHVAANQAGLRLRLGQPLTSPGLKAELKETGPSRYAVHVRSVSGLSGGPVAEEITLPVLDPAAYAPLVIRVRGQVGAALHLQPPRLLLEPPAGGAASTSARVTVSSTAGRTPRTARSARSRRHPVDPADITVQAPAGVTAVTASTSGRTVISFSFPAAVLSEHPKGRIELETSCCGKATVEYAVNLGVPADDAPAVVSPEDESAAATAASARAGETSSTAAHGATSPATPAPAL